MGTTELNLLLFAGTGKAKNRGAEFTHFSGDNGIDGMEILDRACEQCRRFA